MPALVDPIIIDKTYTVIRCNNTNPIVLRMGVAPFPCVTRRIILQPESIPRSVSFSVTPAVDQVILWDVFGLQLPTIVGLDSSTRLLITMTTLDSGATWVGIAQYYLGGGGP